MKLKDMLGTAFMNLWRRKLRAILTVLGMVIGTSSIVVMVSLGIGIRSSIVESYGQPYQYHRQLLAVGGKPGRHGRYQHGKKAG